MLSSYFVVLILESNELRGTIPTELGLLDQLTYMDLSKCTIDLTVLCACFFVKGTTSYGAVNSIFSF